MPDRDRSLALAERIKKEYGLSYHKLDIGAGVVVDGDYDMDQYIHQYGLPRDLHGKTALDVGTASGYFAFELERRGAQVTAIDMWGSSYYDEVIACKESRVRYVQKSVYDLKPDFGQFDLVLCGSLLLHLPDPVGALRAIRSVCKDHFVLATLVTDDPRFAQLPVCEFLARKANDGDYYTYWRFTVPALVAMLGVANFSRVEIGATFNLEGKSGWKSLHTVLHAWV